MTDWFFFFFVISKLSRTPLGEWLAKFGDFIFVVRSRIELIYGKLLLKKQNICDTIKKVMYTIVSLKLYEFVI